MLSDLMIFVPIVPFVLFLAWGCWKQRKNSGLPLAFAGGVAIIALIGGVGMGGLMLGVFAMAVVVAIGAIGWTFDKLWPSSPETEEKPRERSDELRQDPLYSEGYVTPQFQNLPTSVTPRPNSVTTWRAVPKK
jgi:hypothetical protein